MGRPMEEGAGMMPPAEIISYLDGMIDDLNREVVSFQNFDADVNNRGRSSAEEVAFERGAAEAKKEAIEKLDAILNMIKAGNEKGVQNEAVGLEERIKKRNKVHELFGMGKKKMNPDGTECKGCKGLKWAQNDVEIQGWQDRYAKSGQWFKKRREDPKFAEPRMPDDEHYMRGWKRGEQDADDEAKYSHIGLEERIKKAVARKLQEKAKSKNQQQFMGMVKKCQETGDCASAEVKKAADSMKKGDVDDFARTKHKGLPDTVEDKK